MNLTQFQSYPQHALLGLHAKFSEILDNIPGYTPDRVHHNYIRKSLYSIVRSTV